MKRRELLPSKRYAHVENKENFIAQNYFMEEADRYAEGEMAKAPAVVEREKGESFFARLAKKLFG